MNFEMEGVGVCWVCSDFDVYASASLGKSRTSLRWRSHSAGSPGVFFLDFSKD